MPSFASKAVRRRDRIYTPTPVYLAALTGTCVRTATSTRMRAPAPARAACTAAHGAVCSAASCANLQWRREAGPRPPRCSGCSGDRGAQRVVRPGSRIRAPRLGPPAATSRALFSTTAGSEFGAPPILQNEHRKSFLPHQSHPSLSLGPQLRSRWQKIPMLTCGIADILLLLNFFICERHGALSLHS